MPNLLNKAGLLGVLKQISGLGAYSVAWGLDPDPTVSDTDMASIRVKVRQYQPNGTDEHRYSYSDGTFTTEEIGQRIILLTLRAEAYNISVEAHEYLEIVRASLNYLSTADTLNSYNLSFAKAAPTVDVSYDVDNRAVNAATMDIWLNGVLDNSSSLKDNEQYRRLTQTTWIQTVNGNNKIPGTFTGPMG